MTRSVGWTSRSCTAQRLRATFDERRPITQPAKCPPAPPTSPGLLSIGQLAERTGVPTSALRYDDDLGLVRPATRTAGRRRYAASAVKDVGLILFFHEIG